jgi:hypothetical protein
MSEAEVILENIFQTHRVDPAVRPALMVGDPMLIQTIERIPGWPVRQSLLRILDLWN